MAALKRVLAQALSGALIEAGNVQDGSGVFDQKIYRRTALNC